MSVDTVAVEVAAEALTRAGAMLATSSKDWGEYGPDAWLWGLLCGWDCEEHPDGVHDDVCGGGSMATVAARHGWTDETVARLRRYRGGILLLQNETGMVDD